MEGGKGEREIYFNRDSRDNTVLFCVVKKCLCAQQFWYINLLDWLWKKIS